ncbi:glycosyl hydrolase family protein 43 [Tanacetum coccineum]
MGDDSIDVSYVKQRMMLLPYGDETSHKSPSMVLNHCRVVPYPESMSGVRCSDSAKLESCRDKKAALMLNFVPQQVTLYTSIHIDSDFLVHSVFLLFLNENNYIRAAAGTAISSSPTGLFDYIKSFRPHEFESRDMTIFKGDDGKQTWWYRVESNTLTREDAELWFFDCLLQARTLDGIK